MATFAGEHQSPNYFESPTTESIVADVSPAPTPEDIGREKFAKEWKARYPELKNAISEARAKWMKSDIRSYSFVVKRETGGVSSPWNRSPVLIKIENGTPVSLEVVDKKNVSMYARTDGFETMDTIDKLFGFMEQELEKGRLVTGKYDPVSCYPRGVLMMSNFGADAWASVEITKFRRTDKTD